MSDRPITPQNSLLNELHEKNIHPTYDLQVSLRIALGRGGVHTGSQLTDGKMSGRENYFVIGTLTWPITGATNSKLRDTVQGHAYHRCQPFWMVLKGGVGG